MKQRPNLNHNNGCPFDRVDRLNAPSVKLNLTQIAYRFCSGFDWWRDLIAPSSSSMHPLPLLEACWRAINLNLGSPSSFGCYTLHPFLRCRWHQPFWCGRRLKNCVKVGKNWTLWRKISYRNLKKKTLLGSLLFWEILIRSTLNWIIHCVVFDNNFELLKLLFSSKEWRPCPYKPTN